MPRPFLIVVLASIVSVQTCATVKAADDHPTALQLFQQGTKLYQQKDLLGAKTTLMRVDPVQLSKQERVTLYEMIQDIDHKTSAGDDPASLLTHGHKQAQAKRPAQALRFYRAVLRHGQATPEQKSQASSGAAAAKRQLNAELTRARRSLDEATTDIQAGRYQQAHQKLTAIKHSGLDLGWFDNKRLDRQLKAAQNHLGLGGGGEHSAGTPSDDMASTTNDHSTDASAPASQSASVDEDILARARQLRAQEHLAEGRKAQMSGQSHLAARHFEEALRMDPDNEQAQQGLTQATASVVDSRPQGLLDNELAKLSIRAQAAVAEFKERMNKARQLERQRNYTAALEAVQQSKIVIDQNQTILPAADYNDYRDQAVQFAKELYNLRIQEEARVRRDAEILRTGEAQKNKLQAEEQREQEVNELLHRAHALRREQKYDRALELLSQALFLDANNIAAQLMKETVEDAKIFVDVNNAMRNRNIKFAEVSLDLLRASTPFQELMAYPNDWPQITSRRLSSRKEDFGESEINRRVAAQLNQPIKSVEFENAKLSQVLEFLQTQTAQNFFFNWAQLEAVGIDRDFPISLQLREVAAELILRLVLQQASADSPLDPLGFSIIEGIVTVSTQRDLTRTTDRQVYDIRDLLVEVGSFGDAPQFDLSSALSNTSTGGGGGAQGVAKAAGELFGTDEVDGAAGARSRGELIEAIMNLIRDTVGRPDEWVQYGGDVSSIQELNGNFIVKSTPHNHREIAALLTKLRESRAMQIAVEARFLLVDTNFLEDIGVDFDVQYTGLSNKWGPLRFAQDSISIANPVNTGLPGSFGINTGSSGLGTFINGSGFASTGRAMDLNVSFLDDFQVNLMIRATQSTKRSISLTAPRITFFNGQRAFVVVARQVTFVSDLEPVSNTGGFDPTLSIVNAGAVLDVEGTISADRRYVTLTVRPSLASVVNIREIPQVALTDQAVFQNDNQNNNQGNQPEQRLTTAFIEAPELELTQAAATVSVPDRGTLLMGGQRLMADVEIESGVPVLSRIPFLNRFFTNRSHVKDERSLLILIKPTILIQGELEEDHFPGMMQDPGSFTIGRVY
jgi:type II secretory pathway component GspD/PulD (secretin)/tetratricopeptide (TPR) repeat protein